MFRAEDCNSHLPACDDLTHHTQDMLGLYGDFAPKFVKVYANLGEQITAAVRAYCREVQDGTFPAEGHAFGQ